MNRAGWFLLLGILSGVASAQNCNLVYDEFDNLMNKDFLLHPEKYVELKTGKLSIQEFKKRQSGRFQLFPHRKKNGIAIFQTNKNRTGKLLFNWEKSPDNKSLMLVIKEAVIFTDVKSGYPSRRMKNLKIRSSYTLDLDTGKDGGTQADIWFHNVNGKEMYIQAINGAKLFFPMRSLCRSALVAGINNTVHPTLTLPAHAAVNSAGVANSSASSPNVSLPAKVVMKRELLANGRVRLVFQDGSVLERFKGGVIKISPEGIPVQHVYSTAAPPAFPVEAPEPNQQAWLEFHRQQLLSIIEIMVGDTEQVQAYLENVDNSNNLYQSIYTRSQTIEDLVLP